MNKSVLFTVFSDDPWTRHDSFFVSNNPKIIFSSNAGKVEYNTFFSRAIIVKI